MERSVTQPTPICLDELEAGDGFLAAADLTTDFSGVLLLAYVRHDALRQVGRRRTWRKDIWLG